jgi:fused signal recognition particle receptor
MFDLKSKLRKTREGFVSPLRKVFQRRPTLSAEDEETIEELLLGSDMGVDACERVMDDLKNRPQGDHKDFLREEFLSLLRDEDERFVEAGATPRAIIVTGVNGVGKTTSIAKLSRHLQNAGKSVLLAAADTFRAAAADQLATWAQRLDVEIIRTKDGGDPAAVAFDACSAAKSRGIDVVIVDTAGRLHTRVNLMEELKKIKRACEKILGPNAVETLLTLDATLGQNSLLQAKEFTRTMDIQGIILTKIDSTAKGGIVIAIRQDLGVPVRYIGAGEGIEDFSEFSAEEFVDALLEG